MLDLRAIRDDTERFRAGLSRRGAADQLDGLLELDAEWRRLTAEVEQRRAEQKQLSKSLGRIPREDPEWQRSKDAAEAASATIGELEPKLAEVAEQRDAILVVLPNLPDDTAPDGETDEDNVEIKRVGEPPSFQGFEPKDHVELGTALGILDLERAARTSGSRFAYLLGDAVFLQLALVRLAMDTLAAQGFTPVIPPVLVREDAMFGTGFLPTDEAQIYKTRDDDLYLVGTSEVPLASIHADEILDADALPLRYVGYSTCFRREAGSHGKDTRGMFRVHQFDKVEMFSFTHPDIERSREEHDFLLSVEESLMAAIDVPYRVVNVCIGDLGAPAAKKFDIEAWLPGQQRYRELTSTSNTTDYQARRLGARVRTSDGTRPVHTLNGTAFAVGRTLIAILENHQRADGSVDIPAALHPYLPERLRTLSPRA
jgi:seryl-tRNA synthetase